MEETHEVHAEDRELVEKLAKLQDIHQQINHLRGLLPERLLRPTRMALENPRGVSPEKLAANIRKAATDGSRDIRRFKKDYNSPEMKELWQKTNVSETGQGRDSWNVDYMTLVKSYSDSKNISLASLGNESSLDDVATENEEAVLTKYEDPHYSLHIERASQSNIYPLSVTINDLKFHISRQEREGNKVLVVENGSNGSNGPSSSLTDEIIQTLKDRSNPSSLEILLSMLASYQNLKFQSCDKCQSIFDRQTHYALARRRKSPANKDSTDIEWEILHRDCVS